MIRLSRGRTKKKGERGGKERKDFGEEVDGPRERRKVRGGRRVLGPVEEENWGGGKKTKKGEGRDRERGVRKEPEEKGTRTGREEGQQIGKRPFGEDHRFRRGRQERGRKRGGGCVDDVYYPRVFHLSTCKS